MGAVIEDLDVDRLRMMRRLRKLWPHLHIGLPEPFGPSGVDVRLLKPEALAVAGSVIVTQCSHAEYGEWVHASIAWTDHMPSYEDLTALKDAVFGPEREAYQVFPPASRHVSIHDYALHLWGRADGSAVLPVFGADGTI